MNLYSLLLVLFSVSLTVAAQLLLKKGAVLLPKTFANSDSALQLVAGILGNYPLMGGLLIYALSAITWILALTKVNVSLAYPFVGLGIVGTTLAGYFLFNEKVSLSSIIGIALVILGLIFIAKN